MTTATRSILILFLSLTTAGALVAQEEPSSTEPAAATPAEAAAAAALEAEEQPTRDDDESDLDNYQIRSQLSTLLRQHPGQLSAVLGLDPDLLENEEFLARYPELARFVEDHPEVRRNPHFYVEEFRRHDHGGVIGDILEVLAIIGSFVFSLLAVAWFIRTLIEQKRWSRLSQTQSEVHNKILDRFDSSEELLEYVKTPAGARFLESAPIPLHTDQPEPRSPWTRVLWSVQIGVVIAVTALGILLVSLRFDEETAQGLFALGVIALSVGVGFVGSAAVSIFLSRRFGLLERPGSGPASSPSPLDESEFMG